jgi:cytochrome c5
MRTKALAAAATLTFLFAIGSAAQQALDDDGIYEAECARCHDAGQPAAGFRRRRLRQASRPAFVMEASECHVLVALAVRKFSQG